jgi:hypothetical protein
MGLDQNANGSAIEMAAPQESVPPSSVANIMPDQTSEAQTARHVYETFKETLSDLKTDVREIRGHRVPDLVLVCGFVIGAFVLLGGMLIFGYFRLEAKIDGLSTASTRVETKLDDALQRNAVQLPGKQGQ